MSSATESPGTSNTATANWKRNHHLSKKRVVDDSLCIANWDRTKSTPREAMDIVAPALKDAEFDLNGLTLPTSSLYNCRKGVMKVIGEFF